MTQTAVEWLIEQWPILESQIPPYIIEEAKGMERQQTEISDEEIEKGAKEWYEKERPYKPSAIALNTWIRGAKWYREQLKNKA